MIDMDVIKILEARHDFILAGSSNANENSFSFKELRALEEAIDFTKWVLNNASDATVHGVIEKYTRENAARMDAQTGKQDGIETNNAKSALLPRMANVFRETSTDNRKIQIVLSQHTGVYFVQMEVIRRNPETRLWRRVAYVRVSLYKFEKILKKVQAIIKKREQENPETASDDKFIYKFLSKYPENEPPTPNAEEDSLF
jgi:hypothetical protein